MNTRKAFALAATLATLLGPLQAVAETQCRPQIAVGNVQFSQAVNLRRYWTASVSVDESNCAGASSSGLFSLGFLRLAESGADLEFKEPFIWRGGETAVRVEFWADEAVGRHWIADVAACPCRSK
jgi:hypothetical protein